MSIRLHPGDFFSTANPMALGRAINAVQSIISYDGKSFYSHSGIITNAKGDTFEALWKLERGNLSRYEGKRIVIARWEGMTQPIFDAVFQKLYEEHNGQWYPGWRLFLQPIPPLARLLSYKGKYVVCSELTAKFLYYCHAFLYPDHDCENEYCWPRNKWFTGMTPDVLCDEWHRWQGYKILFEGILEAA